MAPLLVRAGHAWIEHRTGRLPGRLQWSADRRLMLERADRSMAGVALPTGLCLAADCAEKSPLPVRVRAALLYQEDRAYLEHPGFSLREIRLAFWNYPWHGQSLRGASTITQQTARILFDFRSRSARRQLLELRLARLLEMRLGKARILQLYAGQVYVGRGAQGLQHGSRTYFSRNLEQLGDEQIAFLVAQLPSPGACRQMHSCHAPRFRKRWQHLQDYLKNIGN